MPASPASASPKAPKGKPLQALVHRHGGTLLALAGIAVLLGVWEAVAYAMHADYILPRFSQVVVEFGRLWAKRSFYVDTGRTVLRCLAGFGVAFVLGVGFGILGGILPRFRRFLRPIVAFFRAAPTMALTLVIMVWFRNNITPICIGLLMVFPILYTTVADSVATTDADLLQMAAVYRFTRGQKVRYVYLPHATPMVFSASATAFALNIKATVSAEILAHTVGSVGMHMYVASGDILEGTALLYAWLLVAVLLSVLFEGIIKGLQYLVTRRYRHAA